MSERNGEERKSKTAIVFRLRTHHLLCFFLYFRRVFFLLVGVHLVLFIFSCLFHRCWEEEAHERQKKNINLLVVDDRPPKRAPSITVASFRLRDSFVTQLARAGHRISFFYLFFFFGGGVPFLLLHWPALSRRNRMRLPPSFFYSSLSAAEIAITFRSGVAFAHVTSAGVDQWRPLPASRLGFHPALECTLKKDDHLLQSSALQW